MRFLPIRVYHAHTRSAHVCMCRERVLLRERVQGSGLAQRDTQGRHGTRRVATRWASMRSQPAGGPSLPCPGPSGRPCGRHPAGDARWPPGSPHGDPSRGPHHPAGCHRRVRPAHSVSPHPLAYLSLTVRLPLIRSVSAFCRKMRASPLAQGSPRSRADRSSLLRPRCSGATLHGRLGVHGPAVTLWARTEAHLTLRGSFLPCAGGLQVGFPLRPFAAGATLVTTMPTGP